MTSPKSQKGMRRHRSRVLSASKAPQPPSVDCMPIIQRTPRCVAACSRARSGWSTRRSARITSAASSMSGYVSLANSKAQPPGSRFGRRTAQSPVTRISSSIIHSAARTSAGWSLGSPASARAITARQVSHTGDWHASSRRTSRSGSRIVNPSRPRNAARITGSSVGYPISSSAIIEYTHGGWMPPHDPSASCRRRIHCVARWRAARRRARLGRRS